MVSPPFLALGTLLRHPVPPAGISLSRRFAHGIQPNPEGVSCASRIVYGIWYTLEAFPLLVVSILHYFSESCKCIAFFDYVSLANPLKTLYDNKEEKQEQVYI